MRKRAARCMVVGCIAIMSYIPVPARAGIRKDVRAYIANKRTVDWETASRIAAALVASAQRLARSHGERDEMFWLGVLVGIAQTESNFSPVAVSGKDALGVMQVHWPTWGRKMEAYGFGREALFDPAINVLCGSAIYSDCVSGAGEDVVGGLYRYYGAPDRGYAVKVLRHAVEFTVAQKRMNASQDANRQTE